MSGITLSVFGKKQLERREFVRVNTSFVTEEGPAIGSIWYDIEMKRRKAFTIERIIGDHVIYEGDNWDKLKGFLDCVREGRYILIGCTLPPQSHTEI